MMYYSKTTKGFYKTEVHGDNMPDDVVEIEDSVWEQLLKDQENGKVIVPDDNGYPISKIVEVVEIPELTLEQKLAAVGLTINDIKAAVKAK